MNWLRRWSLLTRFAQSRSYQNRPRSERKNYSVILPVEPFIFGVNHIQPRVVPDHIVKPTYAKGIPIPTVEIPLQDHHDGKIELGGEAELKTRESALLAKKVREFAGTQVKVRLFFCYNSSNIIMESRLTFSNTF